MNYKTYFTTMARFLVKNDLIEIATISILLHPSGSAKFRK